MNDELKFTMLNEDLTTITLPYDGNTYSIDTSKSKATFICNGFSIKDTILEILNDWDGFIMADQKNLDKLAQEITDALAEKLHLKQG